jgi:hypothetical protein
VWSLFLMVVLLIRHHLFNLRTDYSFAGANIASGNDPEPGTVTRVPGSVVNASQSVVDMSNHSRPE